MAGTPGALIFFCFFSSIKRRKEGLRPLAKFSLSRFGYIPYPANFPGLGRGRQGRLPSRPGVSNTFCTRPTSPAGAPAFFARFPEEMSRKSLWRAISSGNWQPSARRDFSLPLFRFSPIPVIHLHPSERTIRNEYKIVITYKTTRYADH